MSNKIPQEI